MLLTVSQNQICADRFSPLLTQTSIAHLSYNRRDPQKIIYNAFFTKQFHPIARTLATGKLTHRNALLARQTFIAEEPNFVERVFEYEFGANRSATDAGHLRTERTFRPSQEFTDYRNSPSNRFARSGLSTVGTLVTYGNGLGVPRVARLSAYLSSPNILNRGEKAKSE